MEYITLRVCDFCGKQMEHEEMINHECDEHKYYNWLLFKGFEQSCIEDPNIIILSNSEVSLLPSHEKDLNQNNLRD